MVFSCLNSPVRFIFYPRKITKIIVFILMRVKQNNSNSCAIACFQSVMEYYSIQYCKSSLPAVKEAKGSSLYDLKIAFNKENLRADAYFSLNKKLPSNVNLPLILLLGNLKETGHYVVLYKLENNYVIWLDPAIGELVHLSKEVLKTLWTGVYLEIKV